MRFGVYKLAEYTEPVELFIFSMLHYFYIFVMVVCNVFIPVRCFSSLNTAQIPSGLVCVYKPRDWSSSDVVVKIRNIMQTGAKAMYNLQRGCKIKVGHGGTLDPMAEGVLVIGIGEGTKLMGDYLAGSKMYRTVGRLGTEYDTMDCTGTVINTIDCSHITLEALETKLSTFRGNILQVPPMFSALKRNGTPMYELARDGIVVEREARPVTVYNLELASPKNLPYFGLNIECSGGFYVRSLISDLAKSCDGCAHMTGLIRVKQGPFELSDCLSQKDWNFDAIREHIHTCSKKANINSYGLRPAVPVLSIH